MSDGGFICFSMSLAMFAISTGALLAKSYETKTDLAMCYTFVIFGLGGIIASLVFGRRSK